MIRVAFATDDRQTVNLHFGASEQFVLYDVAPGIANLVGVWQFVKLQMKGVNAERNPDEPLSAVSEERMSEDKVIEKIEFLRSCAGVYAAKIGTSSIKRLMQFDIQPIIVKKGFPIIGLLNEVSLALTYGGLSWVDRAVQNAKVLAPMHATDGPTCVQQVRYNLITSVDDPP